MTTFFERVVAATKLTPLLAPFVVRRICVNQGVDASALGPSDLARILPKLAEAVARYLEPGQVPEMRDSLERLARSAPDTPGMKSA